MAGGWQGSNRRARLPRNWAALRNAVLTRDPLCMVCCKALSTEVDHIRPGDEHTMDNLRGLCGPCHTRKSSSEGGTAWAAKRAQAKRPPEKHPGLI